MEKITEKPNAEVAQQWKDACSKAKEAVNRSNFAYAFQMLKRILAAEPGYTEARILLHQGKIAKSQRKPKILRRLLSMPLALLYCYIYYPLANKKGKYATAVKKAERLMSIDATNPFVLRFLAQSLQKAGAMHAALSAIEMASRLHPNSFQIWNKLSEIYGQTGFKEKQLEVLQKLTEMRPNDGALRERMTQMQAVLAMQSGWESAESYRDVIKDKDKAHTLEQRQRQAPRDAESLETLITDAEEQVANSGKAGDHQKLADLYRRKKDYERALEHYREALNKGQGADPALEKTINSVQVASYDESIQQWEQYAEETPSEKEKAKSKIKELKTEKKRVMQQYLEDMVQRYPNEPEHHFELGEFYWRHNDVDAALKEFQQSSRSPRFRRRSLVYIGHCMIGKKMYDLAIEQLETVLSELSERMDQEHKEVLYNLGWIYEQKGDRDKAAEYYKEIYKADAGYRDVADKLESFYQDSSS